MGAGYRRAHLLLVQAIRGDVSVSRYLQSGFRCRYAAAVAGLTVVLAGCGSGTSTNTRPLPSPPKPSGEAAKAPATIVADAQKALMDAKSVHLTGSFLGVAGATPSGATGAGTGQQTLDLRLTRDRKGAPLATGFVQTVVTSGSKSTTTKIGITRVGATLYLFGDKAYYQQISSKAATAAGKWLSLPATQDKAIADLTDISALAKGLSGATSVTSPGMVRLDAGTAILLRTGAGATLYVAATGAPYPLRVVRAAATPSAISGTLDFADYNAAFTVKAPKGAVALAKVRG
jgi:hypothetical protein